MNLMKKIAALLGASLHTPQGYRKSRHKTGAALRNPADPLQAARIEAAAAKRARKAEKLYRDARYSGGQNYKAYAANLLLVTK